MAISCTATDALVAVRRSTREKRPTTFQLIDVNREKTARKVVERFITTIPEGFEREYTLYPLQISLVYNPNPYPCFTTTNMEVDLEATEPSTPTPTPTPGPSTDRRMNGNDKNLPTPAALFMGDNALEINGCTPRIVMPMRDE